MLIKSKKHRFHTITNAAYLFGVLSHLGLGFVFLHMKIYEMVWFNFIFSTPIFITSYIMNRQPHYQRFAFLLAFLELLFHQIAGVYFLGWESGFQYFLIYLAGLTFFNAHWNNKTRAFLISTIFLSFVSLYFFFRNPESYHLTTLEYKFFYLSNCLFTFLGLAVLINYYVQTLEKAEKNLMAANQKLSDKSEQLQKTLTERNQAFGRLNQELSEAADYVRTILPPPIKDGHIRIDWRFLPSTSLGGDAFGYNWLDEEHFSLYLIDVSGHGVGAALLSASVINTLRSQSLRQTNFKQPEEVLDALNKAFPSEENNDMFFTIWYGVYNKSTRKLHYASGGHPPALLVNNSQNHNNIKQLRTPNFVIGVDENIIYKSKTRLIDKNSILYLFSDGVYEIRQTNTKMWRLSKLIKLLAGFKTSKRQNLDRIVEHAQAIGSSKNFKDDFTLIEIVFN